MSRVPSPSFVSTVFFLLCRYGNRLDICRGDHCVDLPRGGTLGVGGDRVGERIEGRRGPAGGLRRRRFLWLWRRPLDGSVQWQWQWQWSWRWQILAFRFYVGSQTWVLSSDLRQGNFRAIVRPAKNF